MPAMYTVPLPDMSPVIWMSRMNSAGIAHCSQGPGDTVVSGEADFEGAAPTAKLFQETYIRPKKGADRVVVGPARLAIVRAAVVNASVQRPR